ncbi:HIT family protein, partial [Promicromonospora sp. NPDC060204]|uniref:HIT family protein n=1 Tax=Promicromonospora sp. NPDC060204 TaxID=3347071 RepID=UPI00364B62B5
PGLCPPPPLVYPGGPHTRPAGPPPPAPSAPPPGGAPARAPAAPRGERCYVVLNLYPYNSGHMMVLPYRHVSDYTDLTEAETVELAQMTQQAMRVSRAVHAPAGFNLGINQGEVAGAGIAAHLHQHVVPRWLGDANFLPVVGQTKALPELLADTRRRLAEAWETAGGGEEN